MDLNSIRFKETAEVALFGPEGQLFDDERRPMTITVASYDSTAYAERKRLHGAEIFQRLDNPEDRRRAVLALATLHWTIQEGGECPDCTVDAAYDLYSRHPWIAGQVERAIGQVANFFETASAA